MTIRPNRSPAALPRVQRTLRGRLGWFAGVGVTAAAVQLLVLSGLLFAGLSPRPAGLVAFLFAAQCKYALSVRLTWADRGPSSAARWLSYLASLGVSGALNLGVFDVARHFMPVPLAAAVGILAAAALNFVASDRAVFREHAANPTEEQSRAA